LLRLGSAADPEYRGAAGRDVASNVSTSSAI